MNRHNMEYNSEKDYLVIPEYGRNLQLMIQYAKTIEDDTHRQQFAERIIELMHQMNPQTKSIEDYREKLWKHFFRIADYDINVVPPNGKIPRPEDSLKRPERIGYPATDAKYRHYGNNIQRLIKKARGMEPGKKLNDFTEVIGSYMKLAYQTWNKEHYISDEIIKNDLGTLSNGELSIQDSAFLDNLTNANKKKKPRPSSSQQSGGDQNRRRKRRWRN